MTYLRTSRTTNWKKWKERQESCAAGSKIPICGRENLSMITWKTDGTKNLLLLMPKKTTGTKNLSRMTIWKTVGMNLPSQLMTRKTTGMKKLLRITIWKTIGTNPLSLLKMRTLMIQTRISSQMSSIMMMIPF